MDHGNESTTFTLAAVDLGATSGRVILGGIDDGVLRMKHVARFPNTPLTLLETNGEVQGFAHGQDAAAGEGLYWNIQSLYAAVQDGLREAARLAPGLTSIGIDSWAVDYSLLRNGRLLGSPHHYRDERTARGVELVHNRITPADLFARNGLQHLDFNTVFQLAVESETGFLDLADEVLLIPDLLAYWLTGRSHAEVTNASTTGLLSVTTRTWDTGLLDEFGFERSLLPPLVRSGDAIGQITDATARRLGADHDVQVTAVGSHDTASAVVAVPFASKRSAYISSGTWSLVGLELDEPVLSTAAREANFTNEGGVDDTVRFLKNVSGLWLLSESMRHWQADSNEAQRSADLQSLLAEAETVKFHFEVFDPADARFVPPGDMPSRIAEWYTERGLRPPESPAEVVRCILESLAEAYARTIDAAETLAGMTVDTVHVVGGGSQNSLLCQLTADRTGRTVLAGPVEATAIGNLLVQARAVGLVAKDASLSDLREIVRRSFPVVEYLPETS
ncbi:rhamnulokinase [Brevibacterium zhoupengii]|uniref:rhamnulokinase n=1 Tax=Brevibacterium zhoupengii TaxID=2898795 RepID=UPI001F09D302|nr:rhamnulokinase family protein [Brevibacterium zhoupengii]